MYRRSRKLKFHEYDRAGPTPHLDELIEEVQLEPPRDLLRLTHSV